MSNETTDEYGTNKIRIPYFDPDKPTITPKAWLQFVDLDRKSAGSNSHTEKRKELGKMQKRWLPNTLPNGQMK